MKLIRRSDYKRMPWKNGLGFTDEVSIQPEGAKFPADPFDWRLSLATVSTAGPFSLFNHCDRWLTVIEGNGLTLGEQTVRYGECIRLPGDVAIECKPMHGPALDLGLIFDRRFANVDMSFVKADIGTYEVDTRGLSTCFLFVCHGRISSALTTVEYRETLSLEGERVLQLDCLEESEFVLIKIVRIVE